MTAPSRLSCCWLNTSLGQLLYGCLGLPALGCRHWAAAPLWFIQPSSPPCCAPAARPRSRLLTLCLPPPRLPLLPVILDYLSSKRISSGDLVVVSPDVGGVARARAFAKKLNDAPLAIVDKRRSAHNVSACGAGGRTAGAAS